LNHPPIKGGGNKGNRRSQESPLPSWERDRVRGEAYLELSEEPRRASYSKLLKSKIITKEEFK